MAESSIDTRSFHIPFDLCTATSIGDTEWVSQMLFLPGIRSQLNVSNKGGWTSSMYAAYYGHDNILSLLIENGADVNFKNASQQTALILSTKCGNLKCCEILIQKGAFVDALDSENFTALGYSVCAGYDDVSRFLIKSNANVNMKLGEDQMTPIMVAAAAGHENGVRILIEAKVQLDLKSATGLTPRSLALERGYLRIVSILDNYQTPVFNPGIFPKSQPKKLLQLELPEKIITSPISPLVLEIPLPTDLSDVLDSLGLSSYNELFQRNDIFLPEFLQLTSENLKQLGVDKLGPRSKMVKAILKINTQSPLNKVTGNKQQFEIESLKQKLANCQSKLLQEQLKRHDGNNPSVCSKQIESIFLPLFGLEWQSESLRKTVKALNDEMWNERAKLDSKLAEQMFDKLQDIDRLSTEMNMQVGSVLKILKEFVEPRSES